MASSVGARVGAEAVAPRSTDLPALILAASVGFVLVLGFVVLSLFGRPTEAYVLFVSGPLVSTIVGAVLSRKVAAVEDVARTALAATADMVPASVALAAGLSVPDPEPKDVDVAASAALRSALLPVQPAGRA